MGDRPGGVGRGHGHKAVNPITHAVGQAKSQTREQAPAGAGKRGHGQKQTTSKVVAELGAKLVKTRHKIDEVKSQFPMGEFVIPMLGGATLEIDQPTPRERKQTLRLLHQHAENLEDKIALKQVMYPVKSGGTPFKEKGTYLHRLDALAKRFDLVQDPGPKPGHPQRNGGTHAPDGYHYKTDPLGHKGRALDFGDFANSREKLIKVMNFLKEHPKHVAQAYYNPAGFSIDNGKVDPGGSMEGHDDHLHVAR